MANEVTVIEYLGSPKGEGLRYFCADSAAIEKGSICNLKDANATSGANTTGAVTPCAGIAVMEKVASDGAAEISCLTNCIVKATASGAITLGAPIGMAENNKVKQIDTVVLSGAFCIGYSMETVADAETFRARIEL